MIVVSKVSVPAVVLRDWDGGVHVRIGEGETAVMFRVSRLEIGATAEERARVAALRDLVAGENSAGSRKVLAEG